VVGSCRNTQASDQYSLTSSSHIDSNTHTLYSPKEVVCLWG